MPHRLAAATLTLIAALALAACSTDAAQPGDAPSPSPTAAEQDVQQGAAEPDAETDAEAQRLIVGTGYTFQAPAGWLTPTDVSMQVTPDAASADPADRDGFTDNLNVILSPAGLLSLDDVEAVVVGELRDTGATEITVDARVPVADGEASHVSAATMNGQHAVAVEQFYVNSETQTYIITFSFSADVVAADRKSVYDQVLDSWSWS